jgi:phospholipid:diacylglycerol acyltransferase
VAAYISIAGSHLGVPKAATALLSGELSDTVFGGRMAFLVEHIFGRLPRRDLWSSWGSLWAMLPMGSDGLWGPGADFCQDRSAADDPFCPNDEAKLSPMISITDEIPEQGFAIEENAHGQEPLLRSFIQKQSHMTSTLLDFLKEYGGGLGPETAGARFHLPTDSVEDANRRWYDPARHPLPRAPNMKIFCLYGVGLPTERAYHYTRNWSDDVQNKNGGPRNISEPSIIIDAGYKSTQTNTTFGIRYSDGDGSVPLLSLGYICADAWKRPETGLNPSTTAVFTREYMHKAEFQVDDPMRGGPASCDHVEILGNTAMIEDFIKVATGFEVATVEDDRIISKIRDIAAAINAHPRGGLSSRRAKGPWPWRQ